MWNLICWCKCKFKYKYILDRWSIWYLNTCVNPAFCKDLDIVNKRCMFTEFILFIIRFRGHPIILNIFTSVHTSHILALPQTPKTTKCRNQPCFWSPRRVLCSAIFIVWHKNALRYKFCLFKWLDQILIFICHFMIREYFFCNMVDRCQYNMGEI